MLSLRFYFSTIIVLLISITGAENVLAQRDPERLLHPVVKPYRVASFSVSAKRKERRQQQSKADRIEQAIDEGNKSIDSNHLDSAKTEYDTAIDLDPKEARAYCGIGNSYYYQKRYEEAIVQYKKAIELNAEFYEAYNNLGTTYYAQGRYDDAIKFYKKALQLRPNSVNTHYNMGISYRYLNLYDDAIESLKATIRLRPDDLDANSVLGDIYVLRGRYDEAVEPLRKAIASKYSTDAIMRNKLGFAYYKLNRYDEAIGEFKKATQLVQNYARAYYNLGLCYVAVGDKASANEQYEKLRPIHTSLAKDLLELINQM